MRLGRSTVVAAVLALGLAAAARADERVFTYTYETTTMPTGALEYEQWVTWKTAKDSDETFDRIDFRHEIEYGVTDNFQLAFYYDWRYQDGDSVGDDGEEFRDVAVEAIYSLTNPVTDPLGIALYGEAKFGDEVAAIEAKLLLQKNIDNWIFAWNGTFEPEWEGEDYDEDKLELAQSFGASYRLTPNIAVGGELLHEIEYEDWEEWQDHVVYLGPVVHYGQKSWWVTVTPLFQVSDVEQEADYQTRLLFGINF